MVPEGDRIWDRWICSKKPTKSNGAKEKDSLNVLTNNGWNKDRIPNGEEEKMDGLSMVDGFQVDGHKVDG